MEGRWPSEHAASLVAKSSLAQVAGLPGHLLLLVLTRMGMEPFPRPPHTSAAPWLFLLLGWKGPWYCTGEDGRLGRGG